jgi:hypothetical protein
MATGVSVRAIGPPWSAFAMLQPDTFFALLRRDSLRRCRLACQAEAHMRNVAGRNVSEGWCPSTCLLAI